MNAYKDTTASVFLKNPHLRAFRQKRFRIFFLKTLLLEIPIVLLTLYLQTVTETAFLFGIVAGIALWWLILKPQRLFTPRWLGTIQSISYVQRRIDVKKTHSNAGGTFYTDMRDRTFIRCTVLDDKGNVQTFEKEQRYEQVYRVGDRVLAITGIPYPITLTPGEKMICPLCGNIMPCVNETCAGCNARSVSL